MYGWFKLLRSSKFHDFIFDDVATGVNYVHKHRLESWFENVVIYVVFPRVNYKLRERGVEPGMKSNSSWNYMLIYAGIATSKVFHLCFGVVGSMEDFACKVSPFFIIMPVAWLQIVKISVFVKDTLRGFRVVQQLERIVLYTRSNRDLKMF